MRSAAWMAVGLVFGLALGAVAQSRYTYYYRAEQMASAPEDVQGGYAAGVYDLLRELVREYDGKTKGFYTPERLAEVYTCWQRVHSTTQLVNVTRQVWAKASGVTAASAMTAVIPLMSHRCGIH